MSLHVAAQFGSHNPLLDINLRMSQLLLTIALFDREQALPSTIYGDALAMRLVGTFHLLSQFLGGHLAGGNLGTAECLYEVPTGETGDLGRFPLCNENAAVEVERRRDTYFPV